MIDYREILRLTSLNYSRRTISSCVGSSRNTVSETIDAANAVGIAWPQCESMTNEDLSALLFPGKVSSSDSRFLPPDCAYIHREMAKPGVTLTLLWTEYCAKAKDVGLTPYQYTQFGEKYR